MVAVIRKDVDVKTSIGHIRSLQLSCTGGDLPEDTAVVIAEQIIRGNGSSPLKHFTLVRITARLGRETKQE